MRLLLPLSIALLLVAGCSGDDGGGGGGDDTTSTTAVAETTTTTAPPAPELTVAPAEGLAAGDTVTVEGTGFPTGTPLQVAQCVDAADPDNGVASTTTAECDVQAVIPVEANAGGALTADYVVSAGPFGTGSYVCDATHDCVLTVAPVDAADDHLATATITFA